MKTSGKMLRLPPIQNIATSIMGQFCGKLCFANHHKNVVLLVRRISGIALFRPRNAPNALNAVRVRRIVYLNQGAAALRWKGWMVGADKGNILIADKESSPSPAAAKIWTQATKISGDGRR